MRVCAQPGCPALTYQTRCDKHRKERRRASDRKRPTAKKRGYDKRWTVTRRVYITNHPICEDKEGCISPATEVHHIDGQGPKGPRGHDPENLQALCKPHHDRITAREQPGGFRQ